ncbi:putative mitochondrial carrier protein [Phaeoacremonium minimum UCRPA7]|uniref:Putative mitochondrial carrier protein n=1 Tax=Phaeoacremonium minimum (strain UCR-PA7) TaxID=1286976 RepID=R8BLA8_PHAM7|nr:putative mitochondrial carrier protein [Phaeoacremonium minimum UCRPA7]EOO00045.1 putative mitochondrial carrier protein [Phaeoacremonium minimum UCRPA7]
MSNEEIIRAYRHLYRGLLRAVQYSKPARFVARDQLRAAFREKQAAPAVLDPRAVYRTILFLKAAAVEAGLEHKILQNLLRTAHARQHEVRARKWSVIAKEARDAQGKPKKSNTIKDTAYQHYEMTIAMLNKTMGLCLR